MTKPCAGRAAPSRLGKLMMMPPEIRSLTWAAEVPQAAFRIAKMPVGPDVKLKASSCMHACLAHDDAPYEESIHGGRGTLGEVMLPATTQNDAREC